MESQGDKYVIRLIHALMRQKLTVNLAVFVILVAGIYSLSGLNRESIPQISLDMVSVVTVFPGAAPNDAEELISIPIEKKLRGVSGIDKVRSYNVENVSFLVIYLDDRAKDKKKIVQDIKDAVEQVEGLPASVQKPSSPKINFDNTELVSVAFVGKTKDVPYARLQSSRTSPKTFSTISTESPRSKNWGTMTGNTWWKSIRTSSQNTGSG